MPSTDPSPSIWGALAKIPSGAAVLTAEHQGTASGMLVSWFQQASFDPPMISVCIRHGRPISGLIEAAGTFTLNMIGDNAKELFRHFGKGFSLDENAFQGVPIEQNDAGPILMSAAAHLTCQKVHGFDAGDHRIYLGRVTRAEVRHDSAPYVHLRKSGASY